MSSFLLVRFIVIALFVGVLAGKWDIWWHVAVGRDTFFEPPHLFLYGGVVAAILLSWYGWWRSRERNWLLLALVLLVIPFSAPFDEWWHRIFGIEVLTSPFVIWSPPHLLLILSIAAGCWFLLPLLRRDPDSDLRRLLLALTLASTFSVLFVLTIPLDPLGAYNVLGFSGAGAAAALAVALFFLAERVLGGTGSVFLVTMLFLVFQSVGVREKVAAGIVVNPHAYPPHWLYIFSLLLPAIFVDGTRKMSKLLRGAGAGFLYTAVYYGFANFFIDSAFIYTTESLLQVVGSGTLGGLVVGVFLRKRWDH